MLKGKAGFILKLQAILANPEHGKVVSWSKSGSSFLIYDLTAFEDILTAYFRHKRFSSFVRQLNMYGFHKCRGEKMGLEFKHPLFTRQKPEDHLLIDRKKTVEVSFQLPTISKILEINSMRDFDPMNESPELAPSEVEEELIPSTRTKFRLNSSQMTIKLNERLTSLCSLEENDDHSLGYLKTESMPLCPEESLQKEGSVKTSQMETLLFQ